MERPDYLLDEHLEFLDNLRDEGTCNMFGARKYVNMAYPELSQEEARKVLSYWMKTYGKDKR
jgi:hypothetical protein